MSQESINRNAGQLGDLLESVEKPIVQASTKMSNEIYSEAKQLCACANERIRQNPLPIVAGAVAFGVAMGYWIACRHTPSFQENYVDEPLEQVTDTLGSIFSRLPGNLKFW